MKRYIVTELDLLRFAQAMYTKAAFNCLSPTHPVGVEIPGVREAEEAVRAVPVPEWATHFAGDLVAGCGFEEIK